MSDDNNNKNKIPVTAIVTILLFLLTHSFSTIWFLSEVNSKVANLEKVTNDAITEFDLENLRQWSRINEIQNVTNDVNSEISSIKIILKNFKEDIDELKDDVKETNSILKGSILNSK
jgi:peptidoglycan hydrolase CwlO-like protein